VPAAPAAATASLEQALSLANRGALAEAAALCERQIRDAGPSAAAYCLLAIVKQADSDAERAIENFNKALYLDPQHHEALVHLALLHERRGEMARAEQYRRRAERAQKGSAAR
jgi:chemotaxis protein methyltransferase WspC